MTDGTSLGVLAAIAFTLAACSGAPSRVAVPHRDATPPGARIVVMDSRGGSLAVASLDVDAAARLSVPRFTATAVGEDAESGVARVRVSLHQELVCRRPGGGEVHRGLVRYWPPPQVERIRAAPGAELPARDTRRRRLTLRCGDGARLVRAHVEVWAEVIDGLGLEAITRRVRLRYEGRP